MHENAMAYELRKLGIRVQQQVPLKVWYDDIVVGEYVADLIVEETILVELKAISGLEAIHSAICINYVTATNESPAQHKSVCICAPSVAKLSRVRLGS